MSVCCIRSFRVPFVLFSLLTFALPSVLFAQRRVDGNNMYHRAWAVVPMVGSGTLADPYRPKHVPAAPAAPGDRSGILGFASTPTDDGTHAIVLFVAANRAALNEILQDTSPGVVAFAAGKSGGAAIEAALARYKANFHLSDLRVVVP